MEARQEPRKKISVDLLELLKKHELDDEENIDLISKYPKHAHEISRAFVQLKGKNLLSAKYHVLPKEDSDIIFHPHQIASCLIELHENGIDDELLRNELGKPNKPYYWIKLTEYLLELKKNNIYNLRTVAILNKYLKHFDPESETNKFILDILILSQSNNVLIDACNLFERGSNANRDNNFVDENIIIQIYNNLIFLKEKNLLDQHNTLQVLEYPYHQNKKSVNQSEMFANLIVRLNANQFLDKSIYEDALYLVKQFEYKDALIIIDLIFYLAKHKIFDNDICYALESHKIVRSLFPSAHSYSTEIYSAALILNKELVNTHILNLSLSINSLIASNEFNSLSNEEKKNSLLKMIKDQNMVNPLEKKFVEEKKIEISKEGKEGKEEEVYDIKNEKKEEKQESGYIQNNMFGYKKSNDEHQKITSPIQCPVI